MKKNSISIAVIGLGRMGQLHAASYYKMPFVNLKAICDTNEGRLAEFCEKYSTKGYTDYNEMLKDDSIDAISICLPDNMHKDVIIKAINKGKNIMCEKPLTTNLEEAYEIADKLENYDKVFMVGYCLRFDPRQRGLKARLDKGELGDVISIYNRRNSPIVGAMHYSGYSDLAEHVMIHDIDMVNWLLKSKPKKVYAKSRSVVLKDKNMTDAIFALLEYPCGALVCLESSWVLPRISPEVLDDRMEIICTDGAVYLNGSDTGITFVLDSDAKRPVRHGGSFDASEPDSVLYNELTSFVNYVVNNRPSEISVHEAVEALEVVYAIKRSIKEGCEVTL